MRLRLALTVLFMGLSGTTLASQFEFNEIKDAPAVNQTTTQSMPNNSILSVLLYLPLFDNNGWSSTMGLGQMMVTPTTTYPNITGIYVRQHDTIDGSCNDTAHSSYSGISGAAVTLQASHGYSTTDASNWALKQVYTVFDPAKDVEYYLADNNGIIPATYVCIAAGGSCFSSTDCGWAGPRTWTP